MTVVLFESYPIFKGDRVQLARNPPKVTGKSPRTNRFKNMSPEDRVNMAVEMSSVVSTITMESIPLPRERSLKDKEDVRAIIRNTRVDKRKILNTAKRDGTLTIFRETIHRHVKVRGGRRMWGKEAFPDAGEATFGD